MSDPAIFKVVDPQNPKEAVYIRFEWQTEKNEAESDKAGAPLFDTILLAFISAPGMTRSEATKVCERKDPHGKITVSKDAVDRYGPQIEAFKRGDAPPDLMGIPLAELSGLDAAMRATLKAMNIHTVEGLASMAGTTPIMGFHKYQRMAQAYLDQREGQAPVAKLAAELEAEREKNGRLEKTVQDLAGRLAKLEVLDEKPTKQRKAA